MSRNQKQDHHEHPLHDYFTTRAEFLRGDLEADHPSRREGALFLIVESPVGEKYAGLTYDEVVERFGQADALEVIAWMIHRDGWRDFVAELKGEPTRSSAGAGVQDGRTQKRDIPHFYRTAADTGCLLCDGPEERHRLPSSPAPDRRTPVCGHENLNGHRCSLVKGHDGPWHRDETHPLLPEWPVSRSDTRQKTEGVEEFGPYAAHIGSEFRLNASAALIDRHSGGGSTLIVQYSGRDMEDLAAVERAYGTADERDGSVWDLDDPVWVDGRGFVITDRDTLVDLWFLWKWDATEDGWDGSEEKWAIYLRQYFAEDANESEGGPIACDECGADMVLEPDGTSHHLDPDGEIDWDTDRDHVAFSRELA